MIVRGNRVRLNSDEAPTCPLQRTTGAMLTVALVPAGTGPWREFDETSRRVCCRAPPSTACRLDCDAATRRRRRAGAHQGRGTAALPSARAVSNAHRRNWRTADRLAGSPTGGELGARPFHGVGPHEPASRTVRVRPWLAARTHLGRDDRAALLAAHRVR